MSVTGMYDHTCILVDHKHIIVLMNDIQRNILWKDFQSPSLIRHHELYDISGTDDIVRLDYLVVDSYIFCLYCKLDPVTRGILHMRRKILIHTHRLLTSGNIETVMLEHFLLLIVTLLFKIQPILCKFFIKIEESIFFHHLTFPNISFPASVAPCSRRES